MVLVGWVLLVVVSAVVVVSCGGSDADEVAKSPAPQKAADAATSRELQEVLDFQRESYGATGMAAAIVIRRRHFLSVGSGLANRETKAPVTAETPFPIFSITKMFVAAVAVKLAEHGRLRSTICSAACYRTGPMPTASRCACCSTRPAGSATTSAAWNATAKRGRAQSGRRRRRCATRGASRLPPRARSGNTTTPTTSSPGS